MAAAVTEVEGSYKVQRIPLTRQAMAVIELGTRRVRLVGVTDHPDGGWVVQRTRECSIRMADDGVVPRFLIRDRDSKCTRAFDDLWRAVGAKVIRTPIQAPNANAIAERWVGTVRRECLDHLLITGRRHLLRVLHGYVQHNRHRPTAASTCRPLSSQRVKPSRDRQPPSRSTAATSSAA